ncbi:MAG: hypothetical protein HW407_842 [Bacteroidetes bacterium]|nr:hypothetical protein [Bacteroidota bacterium]
MDSSTMELHAALGATSLTDAVGWKSMGTLFGVALLMLGGRYVQRRFRGRATIHVHSGWRLMKLRSWEGESLLVKGFP